MLRLHGILGSEKDPHYRHQLHHLEHHGGIELLFVPPSEAGRKRFRLSTDRGTDCAISLDRDQELMDGAVLYIDPARAIIARFGEQAVWRLRSADQATALKLGWNAGNLHWRVRFEEDCIVILLDGALADYRARIAHLMEEGGIEEVPVFDAAAALALMQYGDSAYPAGGFAFSWGLEGLAADALLDKRQDLDNLIHEHLALRWNSMDRPLLRRAFVAADVDALLSVDRYVETATFSAQMRDGSRRAGRALLGVAARQGGQLSTAYRARLSSEEAHGHLPVVQAIAYRDAGLSWEAAELLSGWTLVTGLVSAAVRLGTVGHIEGQFSLKAARSVLAELLAENIDDCRPPSSFTPLIDIAVSRGPSRHVRMFST